MGKQFSYYCLPEDLRTIQVEVFEPCGGRLVQAVKQSRRDTLVDVQTFALPDNTMGTESLFLLLLPPEPLINTVFRGGFLDPDTSHVIQVGRCLVKDGQIQRNRFWYESRLVQNGIWVEKPPAFVRWADSVFRHTKARLQKFDLAKGSHSYREWFGPHALKEMRAGTLSPA